MTVQAIVAEPDIDEITRRIVERFRPRRIVLFGSRARGGSTATSDLDLFIEMQSEKSPPERIAEVYELFGLRNWALDVVVYTPDEVTRLRGRPGSLLDTVDREGTTLYDSAA